MKLTAKQQAWIDYYKQGHTATEAEAVFLSSRAGKRVCLKKGHTGDVHS